MKNLSSFQNQLKKLPILWSFSFIWFLVFKGNNGYGHGNGGHYGGSYGGNYNQGKHFKWQYFLLRSANSSIQIVNVKVYEQ